MLAENWTGWLTMVNNQNKQKKHSGVGASSCKRWLNCPGSVAAVAMLPKQYNKYAAEGTLAHEIAEFMLYNGLTKNDAAAYSLCGTTRVVNGFEIEITEEMIEAGLTYSHIIYSDMLKHEIINCPANQFSTVNEEVKQFLTVETEFSINSIDPELFGTNDASVYVPFKRLIVYDFKYGAGIVVDPIANEQLMFYALGVAEKHGGLAKLMVDVIELVIVQPRAAYDNDGVRRWETTTQRLLDFSNQLRAGLKKVRAENPEYKSGEWCRFCTAKPACPALLQSVSDATCLSFEQALNKEANALQLPDFSKPKSRQELTTDQIAEVINKAELIKEWLKAIEAKAFDIITAGGSVAGYKVVEKKSNRSWVDEQKVVAAFGVSYGEDIYQTKLKTPAQLEKLVGKNEILDLVERKSAGLVLVPEADKRQAYDSQSDFQKCVCTNN
jgi:hypothetical protein